MLDENGRTAKESRDVRELRFSAPCVAIRRDFQHLGQMIYRNLTIGLAAASVVATLGYIMYLSIYSSAPCPPRVASKKYQAIVVVGGPGTQICIGIYDEL